jgi:ABC-2 type transport system ATP-binding protein
MRLRGMMENARLPPVRHAALSARGIHKAYGKRLVLRGVDFDVPPGKIVGVVGENGAGKTTLLRIMRGELKPDRGTIAVSERLGYGPQHPGLNQALTVRQHLRYFQLALGVKRLDRAHELLDRLNFADYQDVPVHALSGGIKQKLNLVLALCTTPRSCCSTSPTRVSTGTPTSDSGKSPLTCARPVTRWS